MKKVMIAFLAIAICFVTYQYIRTLIGQKEFFEEKINGIVVKAKDASRGTYYLEIKENLGKVSYTFRSSSDFDRCKINVRDSICKASNSDSIIFYRRNEKYIRFCIIKDLGFFKKLMD